MANCIESGKEPDEGQSVCSPTSILFSFADVGGGMSALRFLISIPSWSLFRISALNWDGLAQ